MCFYCRYLTHKRSNGEDDDHQYIPYRHTRSCHLPTLLRLIGMTILFVMFNITIVLSQSSQIQQQRDQSSSKVLEQNSQGRTKNIFSIFILQKFISR
jgi:hypothetical protein